MRRNIQLEENLLKNRTAERKKNMGEVEWGMESRRDESNADGVGSQMVRNIVGKARWSQGYAPALDHYHV